MTARAPLAAVRRELRALADPMRAPLLQRYFKTARGEYAEGDRFLGLTVPQVRRLAGKHRAASQATVRALLRSPWHEERLLALFLLVDHYRRGTDAERAAIYETYRAHTRYINNWDLVDCSARDIVGAHLRPAEYRVLERLASSPSLWERRIAVIATFRWIAQGVFEPSLRLARRLLQDPHDLIHKAVGWMLREIASRDRAAAEDFLRAHQREMPRTMLRYAIEKFPEKRRREFLEGRA